MVLLRENDEITKEDGDLHQEDGNLHQEDGNSHQEDGVLLQEDVNLHQEDGVLLQEDVNLHQEDGRLQRSRTSLNERFDCETRALWLWNVPLRWIDYRKFDNPTSSDKCHGYLSVLARLTPALLQSGRLNRTLECRLPRRLDR